MLFLLILMGDLNHQWLGHQIEVSFQKGFLQYYQVEKDSGIILGIDENLEKGDFLILMAFSKSQIPFKAFLQGNEQQLRAFNPSKSQVEFNGIEMMKYSFDQKIDTSHFLWQRIRNPEI